MTKSTVIKEIIRVRSAPTGNVHMEVKVTFDNVGDRDFFNSKARNLAEYRDKDGKPEAGIRLDSPLPPLDLQIVK